MWAGPPETDSSAGVFRKALTIEEIPLPVGYDRRVLEPAAKAVARMAHHQRVEEILRDRVRINTRAQEDATYRKVILEVCRRDLEFFADYFCWTYDDRVRTDEPFVAYDFQREKIFRPYLAMCAAPKGQRVTRCAEKSRGVGFTWAELIGRTHSWSFRDNWSVLIGAVAERDVDDGGQDATHESLFGKIRYIIDHLPRWMRDELYGPSLKRTELNKLLLLRHPFKPRNLIVGRHLGAMFGRGHRYSEVFADEIAWAEAMANADTSLKQTTRLFTGGSTPRGKHTFHYQLMKGPLKVERTTLHWSEHPELDVAWYNGEREHMTDEAVAQELDIDYEGSAGNRVLPEVTAATHLLKPEPVPNVKGPDGRFIFDGTLYVPSLPVHAIIDPGISDALALVWIQPDEYNGEWRVIDFVQGVGKIVDWCVPFLLGAVPERTYDKKPWAHRYNPVEEAIIRRHAAWGKPSDVFGDHFGTTRSMTDGLSCYGVLNEYNLFVNPIRIEDDLQAISYLQVWMRHVKVSSHLEHQRNGPPETHPTFMEVLTQWRYRPRVEHSPVLILKPVHDQYCHGGDCLKMYAQTVDLPAASQFPVQAGEVGRARGSSFSLSRMPTGPRR